jgi:uncharacterized RDD family membrane protein YckC
MKKNPLFALRAGAYLMDLLAIYALTVVTMFLVVAVYGLWRFGGDEAMMKDLLSSSSTALFVQISHAVFYFAYFTIAHWYFGRTFGKLAFGLNLLHQGKPEIGLLRSLGRSLAYVVSGQLTLGVGFLLPLFRKDGRTLHDIIMDTDVTRPVPAASEEQEAESHPEAA